ncbi:MAG: hypothetical protein HQ581_19675 [Planctomycetes bacterium]|nr:hypothetical protein [Planctomycetota bacterium]
MTRRRVVAPSLLVVLAILVGIVVPGCSGCGESPTSVDAAMKYLPDNCAMIGTVDMAAILANESVKKIQSEQQDDLKKVEEKFGISLSQVKRVTFGISDFKEGSGSAVVGFTEPIKTEKIVAKVKEEGGKVTEKDVAGVKVYAISDGPAFCFPSEQIAVVGDLATVEAVLKRGKKAELPAKLKAAWEGLGSSETIAVALSLDKVGPIPMLPPNLAENLDSAALFAKFSDEKIDIGGKVVCTEEDTATTLKGMIDMFVGQDKGEPADPSSPPDPAAELLNSLEVSAEGKAMTVKLAISKEMIEKLAPMATQMAGGLSNRAPDEDGPPGEEDSFGGEEIPVGGEIPGGETPIETPEEVGVE